MPSTHTCLHYHLIFATKHRQPILAKEWRHELHSYLGGIVNGLDAHSEGVGGVADHVHLLISLKPTSCLSDFMRELKKILVELDPGVEMRRLPMAGGIRRFHRQRLLPCRRPQLHCQSGRTPSDEILSRGVDRLLGEIRRRLRPALSRLTPPILMASRRDAEGFAFHHPVVSLVPHSTTGYRLRSRWDQDGYTDPARMIS